MTVNQGSALRKLDGILEKALQAQDPKQPAGPILLEAMGLEPKAHNLMKFYTLMNMAKEEAESIKLPKLDRYLKVIQNLHHIFNANHAWGQQWGTFAGHINNGNVLATIDSLANSYHSQNPTFFIETEFLEKITEDLHSLSEEIIQSDLSPELKNFLTNKLAELVKAIRGYRIYGSAELEKATKASISDLIINEIQLEDTDKKNETYKKFQARLLALYMWLVPSPYDIIGAAPDIHDFWKPRIENMAEGFEKIEGIVIETETIQEAIEKTRNALSNNSPKMMEGKDQKALPPSSESLDSTDDADNQ